MCCFTNDVRGVANTSIFARPTGPGQILVYEMTYAAASELAMVLPLPVPAGSQEGAVRFIALDRCADFFVQLRSGFPEVSGITRVVLGGRPTTLSVTQVGDFEASFVPSPADFGRLDPRFRLPAELWLSLNDYRDWGFAVFKLARAEEGRRVHPMAFEFPRRDRTQLFFPTLHIHQGTIDKYAHFDHRLYCQADAEIAPDLRNWEKSAGPAGGFMKCEQSLPLFDLEADCWHYLLNGFIRNEDTWVGREGRMPAGLELV